MFSSSLETWDFSKLFQLSYCVCTPQVFVMIMLRHAVHTVRKGRFMSKNSILSKFSNFFTKIKRKKKFILAPKLNLIVFAKIEFLDKN